MHLARYLWFPLVLALGVPVCGAPPNDPDFGLQWALRNTAQEVNGRIGQAGADISAVAAWDIHAGGSPVVVAIVGPGVTPHPEFADRLLGGMVTPHAAGDPYSTLDTHGLGTHFAGIIAGSMNDANGIAGLNPHASILPVRALQGSSGSTQSVAEGIVWAADNGADVILIPLQYYQHNPALEDAVNYAFAAGALPIAPAGENAYPDVAYPAAYENCIAVTGTTCDDTLIGHANIGAAIEIAAPSENIWSTLRNGGYGFEVGPTSAPAAAYVAGAASLIRSYGPQLSVSQVRQILLESADDLGSPGRDDQFGYGRLNVARALQQITTLPIRFELLDGLPGVLPPGRASRVPIRIAAGTHAVLPQAASLIYRTIPGGIQPAIPLEWVGGDSFAVNFPALPCTVSIEYYLTATANNLTTIFEPRSAPAGIRSATVSDRVAIFHDDFESDRGWSSTSPDDEAGGLWTRVEPTGTNPGTGPVQPEYDRSPDLGDHCFITGQHFSASHVMVGSSDVDGGPVVLTSPTVDLTTQDVEVRFQAWLYSNGQPVDELRTEMTTDDGVTWVAGPPIGPTPGWQEQVFSLSDFVGPSGYRFAIRFLIADDGEGSLIEAGIDDFEVSGLACYEPGDLDKNGIIGKSDWRAFASCVRGPFLAVLPGCLSANVARGGNVDLHDVAVFQRMLARGN